MVLCINDALGDIKDAMSFLVYRRTRKRNII